MAPIPRYPLSLMVVSVPLRTTLPSAPAWTPWAEIWIKNAFSLAVALLSAIVFSLVDMMTGNVVM